MISPGSPVIVPTNYGLVQGVVTISLLNNIYTSFLGIPYAKPPTGDRRFKDPELPEPWFGVLDATREASSCWERDQFSGELRGSEDCLYLNVFTRHKLRRLSNLLPVVVYLHGGAFMFGSSSLNYTGPDYLMREEVVLVTLNSRQGVFGYFTASDESFNIPGNFGLKDQSLALRWIKKNIRRFGGDPDNVLLVGYSSGACAVHHHMLSNWSKHLFHKAMVMSGSVLNTRFVIPEATNFYVKRLARLVGWNETGGLRGAVNLLSTANASEIARAQFDPTFILREDVANGVRSPYGPVVERNSSGFIPVEPRLRARYSWGKDIPVVLSSAADEALLLRKAAAAKGDGLLSSIDFTKLIPRDTGRTYSSSELEALGKKIKDFYFKEDDTSQEDILKKYVQMETDRLYKHGMYRTAISRLRENRHQNDQNTYMYRFDFNSPTMNLYTILKCGEQCRGASHSDDLSYIFRNFLVKSASDIGKREMKTVSNMVAIIHNFALLNDPNPNDNINWIPLNEQHVKNYKFKVLNVGEKLNYFEMPEYHRMQFWSSFYDADHLT